MSKATERVAKHFDRVVRILRQVKFSKKELGQIKELAQSVVEAVDKAGNPKTKGTLKAK